jgi:hypothetical protein
MLFVGKPPVIVCAEAGAPAKAMAADNVARKYTERIDGPFVEPAGSTCDRNGFM